MSTIQIGKKYRVVSYKEACKIRRNKGLPTDSLNILFKGWGKIVIPKDVMTRYKNKIKCIIENKFEEIHVCEDFLKIYSVMPEEMFQL